MSFDVYIDSRKCVCANAAAGANVRDPIRAARAAHTNEANGTTWICYTVLGCRCGDGEWGGGGGQLCFMVIATRSPLFHEPCLTKRAPTTHAMPAHYIIAERASDIRPTRFGGKLASKRS